MTDSELLRLMLGPGATDDRATNERLAAAVALGKDKCPHLRVRCAGPVSPIFCVDCGEELKEQEEEPTKDTNDGTCCAQCGERLKGDRALRMGVCGLCEDESV